MYNVLTGAETSAALVLGAGTTIGGAIVGGSGSVVNVTAATLTVTQAAHAGKLITINAAGGCAVALPEPSGSGSSYKFYNMTALSSASHVFTRSVTGDVMVGIATIGEVASGLVSMFLTASTSNVITLNGTTTGGLGGDTVELIDMAAGQWFVSIKAFGSGTIATPFTHT
jgi:hypothetical protein